MPKRTIYRTSTRNTAGGMKSFSRLVFMLLALVLVGGAIFLATWDIPPPIERVEKVLPDDRFPR